MKQNTCFSKKEIILFREYKEQTKLFFISVLNYSTVVMKFDQFGISLSFSDQVTYFHNVNVLTVVTIGRREFVFGRIEKVLFIVVPGHGCSIIIH